MAIGIMNNNVVGPDRRGPRNQRRSPAAANSIFYPAFMWTPRFAALARNGQPAPRFEGDPFDPTLGFRFPPPENIVFGMPTLGAAHASLPSTETVEISGFRGIATNPGNFPLPQYLQFDDGQGELLPPAAPDGTFNFGIQADVDANLNANPAYVALFSQVFNGGVPLPAGGVTIVMRRLAISEFQDSLTAANAPLDEFARGDTDALTHEQKKGALLFFGKAGCVSCHKVGGYANEMFSDFKPHRIGVPQVFPRFGVCSAGTTSCGTTIFDGAGANEDFGFEQTENTDAMRYMFRTAPLRNLKVAVGFGHNGSLKTVRSVIYQHLHAVEVLTQYDPVAEGLPSDLMVGPFQGILDAGLDPLIAQAPKLNAEELENLVDFVENGLLDPKVLDFCKQVPKSVPSGDSIQTFEGCVATTGSKSGGSW
jgi:cytochrome c peroxidase